MIFENTGLSVYLGCIGILFLFSETFGFDIDYFFGTSLRTDTLGCNGKSNYICNLQCGYIPAACHQGKCYCLYNVVNIPTYGRRLLMRYLQTKGNPEYDVMFPDFLDYGEMKRRTKAKNQPETTWDDSKELSRPILRHHIAHFCPNLDEARNCIRKCMKIGKPAFCGKDHVCYCGHKYSSHDNDEEIDPAQMYSQFQDLYERYFGANNRIKKTVHKDSIIKSVNRDRD